MAWQIDDDEIVAMAEALRCSLGLDTVEDALRFALKEALNQQAPAMTWRERNADLIERARQLGRVDSEFDLKRFRDAQWGDAE